MKKLAVLMLLACISCSKLKGDKGDTGAQGTPGQDATAKTYSGSIRSDYVVVPIPGLSVSNLPIINVYCSDSYNPDWIEIPVYNSATGGNVVAGILDGEIEIWYGYSNGFREYYIVVAEYPTNAPSAKGRFDFLRR